MTLPSSSGRDETAIEPAFSIMARYSGLPTIAPMCRLSTATIGGGDGIGERKPVIVFGNQRDRGEIVELELGVLIDRRIDRLEMRAQQQVVAVPRLREHIARCDHAGGRRFVFDHHALAERLAEL